ncbi:uncharacterized protein BXZ73DRAFT_82241 [Epithele typhae]|uniref:uncharacterized protein n=1 Tax=Epithele typhae TaxID=378194 RepID=UPI002007AA3D|nr:uncharacterized protein BXZ73DRAFT_82241 [Epithele typhae]KAH9912612.1 hypothetical protein BXZ73DRAFT_82241 [Epithele typhae]
MRLSKPHAHPQTDGALHAVATTLAIAKEASDAVGVVPGLSASLAVVLGIVEAIQIVTNSTDKLSKRQKWKSDSLGQQNGRRLSFDMSTRSYLRYSALHKTSYGGDASAASSIGHPLKMWPISAYLSWKMLGTPSIPVCCGGVTSISGVNLVEDPTDGKSGKVRATAHQAKKGLTTVDLADTGCSVVSRKYLDFSSVYRTSFLRSRVSSVIIDADEGLPRVMRWLQHSAWEFARRMGFPVRDPTKGRRMIMPTAILVSGARHAEGGWNPLPADTTINIYQNTLTPLWLRAFLQLKT